LPEHRFSAPQGFSAAVMEQVEARSKKTISLVPLLARFAVAAAVMLAGALLPVLVFR
jgi:hypothetical protein